MMPKNQLEVIEEEIKRESILRRFLRKARKKSEISGNNESTRSLISNNDSKAFMISKYDSKRIVERKFDSIIIQKEEYYASQPQPQHDSVPLHLQDGNMDSGYIDIRNLHISDKPRQTRKVEKTRMRTKYPLRVDTSFSPSDVPKPPLAPRHCRNVKKTRVTIAREKIILLNDTES